MLWSAAVVAVLAIPAVAQELQPIPETSAQAQPQAQTQPVATNAAQPQTQQRYYYYYRQQQRPQGVWGRLMEFERRKNDALLRMVGIR
jgi:hypothetical protein